jgi:hypothetical protein
VTKDPGAPGIKTAAAAGPKGVTVVTRAIQLDGTKSTSGDGSALLYEWAIPQGSPQAAILGGNTATPTVQPGQGRGVYTFQLTVRDASGKSAMHTGHVVVRSGGPAEVLCCYQRA